MSGNHPPPDELPDTRPYLCIPYWTTPLTPVGKWDNGQDRPLPPAIISYACDGIHPGAYVPGQNLDVSVDIRNSGGGNSPAIMTVVVYWADPTVGFAKPKFFSATAVAVPPNPGAAVSGTTAKMTAVIPADAPPHVCLVVSVSHPQDKAGTVCNPVADRHWAQRNLMTSQAAVGAPTIIPLNVANPFPSAKEFALVIGPVDERHAERLAEMFQTQPSLPAATLRLLNAEGAAVSPAGRQTLAQIQMGPLEQRPFQLLVDITSDIPAGHSMALQAQLLDLSQDRRPVGSLGVILLPP